MSRTETQILRRRAQRIVDGIKPPEALPIFVSARTQKHADLIMKKLGEGGKLDDNRRVMQSVGSPTENRYATNRGNDEVD